MYNRLLELKRLNPPVSNFLYTLADINFYLSRINKGDISDSIKYIYTVYSLNRAGSDQYIALFQYNLLADFRFYQDFATKIIIYV